ncbi:MAG: ribosome-associated translation inhibitor RaiA [Clostridia bacterium]|nr:ribosome-associated translation inhibitor RaiA [Clostridia bacterium]MDD4375968.1 ribosome-associated translation inhibitor RaiA [Clostridia bacterium]
MKVILTGKQIDITDAIKGFVDKKIQKLDKFFDSSTIAEVTFSAKKEKQKVDLKIEHKSKMYIANIDTHDIYGGFEEAIEIVIRQIRKEKAKLEKTRRENINIVVEEEPLEQE